MVCRLSWWSFVVCVGAAEIKSSISRIRRVIASFSSASSRTARAAFPGGELCWSRDVFVNEDVTIKWTLVQLKKNMIIMEKIPKIIIGRVKAKPLRSQ